MHVEVFDALDPDGEPWTARALLLRAEGGRARARAERPRRLDHRPAPRAVADARATPPSSSGTSRTASGSSTRWPTGATRDVWRFIREHDLPYNPLHDRGYDSIGCAPCTRPGSGREGRWAGAGQDRVRPARRGLSAGERRHLRAVAPARARGRGDPRHARGRRRARAAGAAVLRRQGLDRAAAPGREGVPPGPLPVPADARRHRPQLPRGASSSATGASRSWASA